MADSSTSSLSSSLSSSSISSSSFSSSSLSSSTFSSSSVSSSGKFSASQVVLTQSTYFCLSATRLHTRKYSMTVLDADGVPMVFNATDVVRIKIGRNNFVPELDLNSSAQTPNGSWVTNTNPIRLNLDQDDLNLSPAVYDIELIIMDDVAGSVVTHIASGIFALEDTQLGGFAVP